MFDNNFTKEEAIKLAEMEWWKDKKLFTDLEVVNFQLWEERLCMNFSDFHELLEECLKRPVQIVEFTFVEKLREDLAMTNIDLNRLRERTVIHLRSLLKK